MDDEKKWVIPRMETLRTLSKESNIPYSRIRAWCLEGKLPYIESGKRWLISVSDFIELLNENNKKKACTETV